MISQLGVCAQLPEWRLHADQAQSGCRCPFVVENHRAEAVSILCTEGDEAEPVMIRTLDPGAQAVLESFNGDYWEAMTGDRVVSTYQPSARRPVWAITDVDCDFVPDLPSIGNENLNETSEPRSIDLGAKGVVKAVMVFIDFSDVQGTGSFDDIKQRIVDDAIDWFRRESYGRLHFSVETPVLQWRRMPEPATAYADIKKSWASHQSYISTALKLFSGEEIAFDAYQLAYVVAAETPADPRYQGVLDNSPTLSAGIEVGTNNGTVHHAVTFGRDSYHRSCRVLVHETGHLFGLPDLYLFHVDADELLTPAGAWDIMCDLDQGRHFLGWHKYKLGWLDESQLIHFNSDELAVTLTSLETAHGVKMIVLPGEHSSQLYIVEVAQALGEAEQFRDKGLLVYTVDASVATGHEPVSVLKCGTAEEDSAVGPRCNAYLAPGENRLLELAIGARIEVTNRKRIGADFEVTIKFSGGEKPVLRKPRPCPHCDPSGEHSVWLK